MNLCNSNDYVFKSLSIRIPTEMNTYISGDKLLGTEVTLETFGGPDNVGVGAHLVFVQHELARVEVVASIAAEPASGQLEHKTGQGN